MAQYQVLYTDHPWSNLKIEQEILDKIQCKIVEPSDQDEETLAEAARDCDVIATCWAQVTDKVISSSSSCKGIVRLGIGLDNIDVAYASQNQIPVTNIPDYCLEEVADHSLALIMSFARNIAFFHLRTKSGEYELKNGSSMHRLPCQTIGLVGFGGIGQALFRKASALGFQVIATSRNQDSQQTGCEMVSLEELLKRSDFVSLHLPLNKETEKMIGEREFFLMKPTARLINTSRGGLVDQDALYRALENNEIAGAGLDVFDPEPPDLDAPLFRDERVIVTPHSAFVSEESLMELRKRTAQQVYDILAGNRPENIVNSEALE